LYQLPLPNLFSTEKGLSITNSRLFHMAQKKHDKPSHRAWAVNIFLHMIPTTPNTQKQAINHLQNNNPLPPNALGFLQLSCNVL
jgi:hypothetical protein